MSACHAECQGFESPIPLQFPGAIMTDEKAKIIEDVTDRVSDILLETLGEINNPSTREMVTRKIEQMIMCLPLETVWGYQVTCDGSNNCLEVIESNRLVADVALWFNENDKAKFRVCTSATGVNFSEI